MKKKFFYFLLSIITIFLLVIFYLSIFGLKTDRFNNSINNKIKEEFPLINFEFKKINLVLRPINLKIQLKTENAIIKSQK